MLYSKITSNVRVSVIPIYDFKNSFPSENRFVFRYNIVVENLSDSPIQLLEREWLVYDTGFGLTEVHGNGVIGLLPEIKPNSNFTYFSNVMLQSGIGAMKGSYLLKNLEDGTTFKVDIPKFQLLSPILNN